MRETGGTLADRREGPWDRRARARVTASATGSSARHAEARERLLAQYAAIPAGEPVRLAKRTTNLFRSRSTATRPGLDVADFDGCSRSTPRRRTADVQGMTTYEHLVDATLAHRLMPTRGAAAEDDHPRRRGDRAGHRVDLVPRRAAARVGRRDRGADRRRRDRHRHAGRAARRPLPPGSRTRTALSGTRCGWDRAGAGPAVRAPAARPLGDARPTSTAAIAEIVASGQWAGPPVDFLDGTVFSRRPRAT